MSKIVWNTLKLSPLLLSATLLLANRTQASEVLGAELAPSRVATAGQTTTSPKPALSNVQLAQSAPTSDSSSAEIVDVTPVAEIAEQDTTTTDAFAQVTSVSQLSDVQPTDWAFQALQSLVERYGCIAGYPDSTYRGNRALTRYEFAAGLNACLDRVNELIAAATSDLVTREDLATLQRLQEEFSAEIATLRGRVDALEATTAELEANQFSTTTKLTGEVIVAAADAFGDEAAGGGDLDVNTILADRVRLNFDTSFFGKDQLRTRLQARNITPFSGDFTGTNMTRLGFDGDEGNDIQLDDVFYRFPLGDRARVFLALNSFEPRDFIDVVSPVVSSGEGSISRFGRLNPVLRIPDESSGLGFDFQFTDSLSLSGGYLSPTDVASDPSQSNGLFNGSYSAFANLVLDANDKFKVGLSYIHSYFTGDNVNLTGSTGSGFAQEPFGEVATTGNSYGVQASFQLSPSFIISAWGGYTSAVLEDGAAVAEASSGDSADIWNYAVSLALPDFGKEGSLLGFVAGVPPRADGNDFGAARRDNDTSIHLEGFYRYQLTDNISITPGLFVILNPEHNDANDTIYVGTVRTTFSF